MMGDMRIGAPGTVLPPYAEKQQTAPQQSASSPAVQEDRFLPTAPEEKSAGLYEMLKDAREKAQEQKDRLQLPKNSARYGDATMQAYARLAKARNRAQVDAAAGYARRCIAQFQTALRQDSENAPQIKAAVNQLKKAVSRAGKKKQELERERLAELQRARLEREKECRQAQRTDQELRRRRALRVIRESGYIREAEIDARQQQQMAATRAQLSIQAPSGAGVADTVSAPTAQTGVDTASAAPTIDTVA